MYFVKRFPNNFHVFEDFRLLYMLVEVSPLKSNATLKSIKHEVLKWLKLGWLRSSLTLSLAYLTDVSWAFFGKCGTKKAEVKESNEATAISALSFVLLSIFILRYTLENQYPEATKTCQI